MTRAWRLPDAALAAALSARVCDLGLRELGLRRRDGIWGVYARRGGVAYVCEANSPTQALEALVSRLGASGGHVVPEALR